MLIGIGMGLDIKMMFDPSTDQKFQVLQVVL
jgi:hypothetical protein